MGSQFFLDDQKPEHSVTISTPFRFGLHEVTQSQYSAVVGSNPSAFKFDNNPVETVSWDDAVAFCKLLSSRPEEKAAGRSYRLPTEAEWEYACRAGSISHYFFDNSSVNLPKYALFSSANEVARHRPVGMKRPNAWGLFDTCGNVFEWCQDWYGNYTETAVTDPKGPKSGSYRVFRGGGWNLGADCCTSSYRRRTNSSKNYVIGFRVVCLVDSD
ncbi:formylglycine-generating enzyme family protein [Mariniblastus sp.]|nr:formylglycine-generating enzyme family protein [Mariniblastus sp.]